MIFNKEPVAIDCNTFYPIERYFSYLNLETSYIKQVFLKHIPATLTYESLYSEVNFMYQIYKEITDNIIAKNGYSKELIEKFYDDFSKLVEKINKITGNDSEFFERVLKQRFLFEPLNKNTINQINLTIRSFQQHQKHITRIDNRPTLMEQIKYELGLEDYANNFR